MHSLQNEKLVLGETVYKFEEEFAAFCGTRCAVSTGSGTAAIQIALQSLGLGSGDGVLTTPFSFIATSNSILHAGARPEFADVDNQDFNIDPTAVASNVREWTRALMPVHLYGYPCRMEELQEIAQEDGLKLVEDACQAHGAEYRGRRVGAFGDAGCFSFYPSKNMTVGGDGGMIVTNNEDVAEVARSIRDCGRSPSSKYTMPRIGYTSRLNTINAAIGRVQLRKLGEWNQERRRLAMLYRHELENVENLSLQPSESLGDASVYHLFVVRSGLRDRIKEQLAKGGVETGIHYPIPIHLQTPYRNLYGYSEGAFPISERLAGEVLSLPIYVGLTDEEVRYICSQVKDAVRN